MSGVLGAFKDATHEVVDQVANSLHETKNAFRRASHAKADADKAVADEKLELVETFPAVIRSRTANGFNRRRERL